MSYRQLTTESKSGIKRFSHRRRFGLAIRLLDLTANDRFLDFGAGDGYFVGLLRSRCSGAEIIAYDPSPAMFGELRSNGDRTTGVVAVDDLARFPAGYFTRIGWFEVVEHLELNRQLLALAEMRHLLASDGTLLISVPTEIGPSSLLKNVVRLAGREPNPDTTLRNVIRSFLGLPGDRVNYEGGHIGFDYRSIWNVFSASDWKILSITCSPWPILCRFLNSQIFFLLQRSNGAE